MQYYLINKKEQHMINMEKLDSKVVHLVVLTLLTLMQTLIHSKCLKISSEDLALVVSQILVIWETLIHLTKIKINLSKLESIILLDLVLIQIIFLIKDLDKALSQLFQVQWVVIHLDNQKAYPLSRLFKMVRKWQKQ